MYTINYRPRATKTEYNGPLSWISPQTCDHLEPGEEPYFCADLSELDQISNMGRFPNLGLGCLIEINNQSTSNSILFRCTDIDLSDSKEDIGGWRFTAVRGHKFPVTMLIIND